MKNSIIIILVLILLTLYPNLTNIQSKELPKKNYWMIGIFDHKTGTSLFGYSYSFLNYNKKHEFFAGVGTLVAMNTLSLGWKYGIFDFNVINLYSVVSLQAIASMGGSIITPFISIGIEKDITDNWFINLGVNSNIRVYSELERTELITYPSLNINFRY